MSSAVTYHPSIGVCYPSYAVAPIKEHGFVQKRLPDADLVLPYAWPKAKRQVVVQAGAHVGCWPMRLSKHFQQVIAFEPCPALAECTRINIATSDRPNITLIEAALSDKVDRAWLKQHPSPARCELNKEKGKVPVWVTTLDYVLSKRADPRCDALILDVEGHEAAVLRGAAETIRRYRPVIQVELLARSRDGIECYLAELDYNQRVVSNGDAVYTYAG